MRSPKNANFGRGKKEKEEEEAITLWSEVVVWKYICSLKFL
jgi:hypothetical protein